MSDLLDLAIDAHGGWERWRQIEALRAHVGIGGAIWSVKGWPGIFDDAEVSIETRRQHVEYTPFVEAGRRSVFEPERTAIVTESGELIEERQSPRTTFAGHAITTPWDAHQLIYFTGYAMWTYLTTPFLFRLPGFLAEEIAPWQEDGETWRRLKVIFPSTVHSHSPEQIFYFDQTGILKRHDYSVDIMGGTSSVNYATEPASCGGIVFPMKRRVHPIGPDNRPIRERLAVAIDFHGIEVA